MLIELLYFKKASAQPFFPVPGTIALVLNMDIGQGSRSRYTFEKHSFNQQHVRLNFTKALCGAFSKNQLIFVEPDLRYFTLNQRTEHEIK